MHLPFNIAPARQGWPVDLANAPQVFLGFIEVLTG
jgi:hypothetical protein